MKVDQLVQSHKSTSTGIPIVLHYICVAAYVPGISNNEQHKENALKWIELFLINETLPAEE